MKVLKQGSYVLLIGFVFTMLLSSCGSGKKWDDGSGPLESLEIDGHAVPSARFGKPSTQQNGVTQGSFAITVLPGSPTTLEDITITANVGEGSVEYAVGTSNTPGEFSADSTITISSGDFLWLKVTTSNTVYYKIMITITIGEAPFTITHDPASRDYLIGDTIEALTITVDPPSASYAYKWFKADTFSNTGGEEIEGEDGTSYNPGTLTEGVYYFYAEVTEGEVKITSRPARIRVLQELENPANVFAIDDIKYQYVRGVGGTGTYMFRDGNNADCTMGIDVEYIDAFMGPGGVGANILRIMLQDQYEDWVAGNVPPRDGTPEDLRSGHYAHNYHEVIRRANSYGAYIYASPWTAPAYMKTNDREGGGGVTANATLRATHRIAYANHIRDYLKWLNENNAPIYAVSLLNEPDWGGSATYEGMSWSAGAIQEWLKLVGHITTQRVTNESAAIAGADPVYAPDIIPGFGGGKNRKYVFVMNAETYGNATFASPIINDPVANQRIDIFSRHFYAGAARITQALGNNGTAWKDKPGLGFTGKYYDDPENTPSITSVTANESEYPEFKNTKPGVVPAGYQGQREVWQTEFDTVPSGASAIRTSPLVHNWGYVFDVLNLVDWSLRAIDESVFNFWYSHTWSGMVGDSRGGTVKNQITTRGRAFAHFGRYVRDTWRLGLNRTSGTISYNATVGSSAAFDESIQTDMSMKISAYEDVNGEFISVVMFAPVDRSETGGTDVGLLQIDLPEHFTAASAHALKSSSRDNYWKDEPVTLSADGKSAILTLNRAEIISVKFVK